MLQLASAWIVSALGAKDHDGRMLVLTGNLMVLIVHSGFCDILVVSERVWLVHGGHLV